MVLILGKEMILGEPSDIPAQPLDSPQTRSSLGSIETELQGVFSKAVRAGIYLVLLDPGEVWVWKKAGLECLTYLGCAGQGQVDRHRGLCG